MTPKEANVASVFRTVRAASRDAWLCRHPPNNYPHGFPYPRHTGGQVSIQPPSTKKVLPVQ